MLPERAWGWAVARVAGEASGGFVVLLLIPWPSSARVSMSRTVVNAEGS